MRAISRILIQMMAIAAITLTPALSAQAAKGSGMMAVDNGDYFLSTEVPIDQTVGDDGEFEVPTGGPGGTMRIYVAGSASSYGALNGQFELYYSSVEGTPPQSGNSPPPPPAPSGFTSDSLGSRLDVEPIAQVNS